MHSPVTTKNLSPVGPLVRYIEYCVCDDDQFLSYLSTHHCVMQRGVLQRMKSNTLIFKHAGLNFKKNHTPEMQWTQHFPVSIRPVFSWKPRASLWACWPWQSFYTHQTAELSTLWPNPEDTNCLLGHKHPTTHISLAHSCSQDSLWGPHDSKQDKRASLSPGLASYCTSIHSTRSNSHISTPCYPLTVFMTCFCSWNMD